MKAATAVEQTDTCHPDILLVEDDDLFASEIGEYLQNHGLTSSRIVSLANISAEIARIGPRIVVLDQFVGGSDALTLLPLLRKSYSGGLIVLTANRDETDRVVGLELGADDFIVKTQPPREILARLRAVLRRSLPAAPAEPARAVSGGRGTGWLIDHAVRALFAPDGTRIDLTSTEFELLAYLSARAGEAVPRLELYDAVLRRPPPGRQDRAIDNLVSRVRLALAPAMGSHNPIKSMRGIGYIFVGLEPDQRVARVPGDPSSGNVHA
jgi:DNA-binding response OmpR family regulator